MADAHTRTVVWCLVQSDAVDSESKRLLVDAGAKRRVAVKFVEPRRFTLVASRHSSTSVVYGGEEFSLPHCLLVWMEHVDAFAAAVIKFFERSRVEVLNCAAAACVASSKLRVIQELSGVGIPVCKTVLVAPPFSVDHVLEQLALPLSMEQDGTGVVVSVQSRDHLESVSAMVKGSSNALLFQSQAGEGQEHREVRSVVLGSRLLASIIKIGGDGFACAESTPSLSKAITLKQGTEWIALEVARHIGLDFAVVDMLLDDDTIKVMGVSTMVDVAMLEHLTDVDIAAQVIEFINIRTGKWNKRVGSARQSVPSVDDFSTSVNARGRSGASGARSSSASRGDDVSADGAGSRSARRPVVEPVNASASPTYYEKLRQQSGGSAAVVGEVSPVARAARPSGSTSASVSASASASASRTSFPTSAATAGPQVVIAGVTMGSGGGGGTVGSGNGGTSSRVSAAAASSASATQKSADRDPSDWDNGQSERVGESKVSERDLDRYMTERQGRRFSGDSGGSRFRRDDRGDDADGGFITAKRVWDRQASRAESLVRTNDSPPGTVPLHLDDSDGDGDVWPSSVHSLHSNAILAWR